VGLLTVYHALFLSFVHDFPAVQELAKLPTHTILTVAGRPRVFLFSSDKYAPDTWRATAEWSVRPRISRRAGLGHTRQVKWSYADTASSRSQASSNMMRSRDVHVGAETSRCRCRYQRTEVRATWPEHKMSRIGIGPWHASRLTLPRPTMMRSQGTAWTPCSSGFFPGSSSGLLRIGMRLVGDGQG
jgi:hypothetical protein